jgi:hypothetical protein
MVIWYIFPRFGMLHQEKSGNPGLGRQIKTQLNEQADRAGSIKMKCLKF